VTIQFTIDREFFHYWDNAEPLRRSFVWIADDEVEVALPHVWTANDEVEAASAASRWSGEKLTLFSLKVIVSGDKLVVRLTPRFQWRSYFASGPCRFGGLIIPPADGEEITFSRIN